MKRGLTLGRRYRSSILVTLAILEAIHNNGWANTMQVMMHASIPHTRLKPKIDEMISLGMVAESNTGTNRKVYTLTERGLDILKKMRELLSLLTSTTLI